MATNAEEILVFPRWITAEYSRFTPWTDAKYLLEHLEEHAKWLRRDEAERSVDWVQPIPCALIRNRSLEYWVVRRNKKARNDLRRKDSLLTGGHIDFGTVYGSMMQLLVSTLRRELDEELTLQITAPPMPLGVLIDTFSPHYSRHVAFVFEVETDQLVKPRAAEEFALGSDKIARTLEPARLAFLRPRLDPWSLMLFEDHLAPQYRIPVTGQLRLPLHAGE